MSKVLLITSLVSGIAFIGSMVCLTQLLTTFVVSSIFGIYNPTMVQVLLILLTTAFVSWILFAFSISRMITSSKYDD